MPLIFACNGTLSGSGWDALCEVKFTQLPLIAHVPQLLSRIPFLFSVVLAYAASFCVMWTGFNGIPEQPQVSTTPTRDLGAAPQEGVRHSCDRSPGNRGGYRGTGHQLRTRC